MPSFYFRIVAAVAVPERTILSYKVSTKILMLVSRRAYLGKTTIYQVIGINGTILIIFHTPAHCWQFRLISAGGEVFGERKIYYSAEAALKAGMEWVAQENYYISLKLLN